VLAEIELFARRLKRSRTRRYADAAGELVRRARHAIADALDGTVRGSVMPPPP
jgi:hypothetical protein